MNLQGEWQGRIPALILAFSSRRFSTELASTSAPVVCSKQHPRVALKSWHQVARWLHAISSTVTDHAHLGPLYVANCCCKLCFSARSR